MLWPVSMWNVSLSMKHEENFAAVIKLKQFCDRLISVDHIAMLRKA